MNEQIGFKNVPPQDGNPLLRYTPTGQNLLAGTDVEFVFDSDPTGTVGTWPDGARGIWPDGAGNIMTGRFLRSTGWCSGQLTP